MVVDGLLSPIGLLALLAVVPVLLLYFVRPHPEERELPTLEFLVEASRQSSTSPVRKRLRRSLLLAIQLTVIAVLALSLATPYVAVSEQFVVEETILVVDGSASMATQDGDSTRFSKALAAARQEISGTTSVVFAARDGRVVLRDGSRADADRALDSLTVTHASGDLRSAVAQASAVAGEKSRIVVLSDFADGTDWKTEVAAARARGINVELRQFGGGGDDNVGIVDRSFSGTNVTVTVQNFGDEPAQRTVALGDQRRRVTLEPGDLTTATFAVPAGGGTVELSPGDSFPVDDAAYLAAPADPAIDVLVLTNNRNRYLTAALSSVDAVSLTVAEPPADVETEPDVVVYSNVSPDNLTSEDVEIGRDALRRGGGVAVLGQPRLPADAYGDLLLIDPEGIRANPPMAAVETRQLTRDISFPVPERYVTGDLTAGEAPVRTVDGEPLVATDDRGEGRVLYYGYVDSAASFKYSHQYPVFWKRAVFHLAGRETLPSQNRQTGERLRYSSPTTVRTPGGTVTDTSVALRHAGYYEGGGRTVGVSLYDDGESDVAAPDLSDDGPGGVREREERRRIPYPLLWVGSLLAGVVAFGELVYLRRRGDL